LPIMIGIVTIITTIRSAGLSCSHETFAFMVKLVKLDRYPMRARRNTFVVGSCRAAFPYSASSFAPSL
jgi:hypothetical protein